MAGMVYLQRLGEKSVPVMIKYVCTSLENEDNMGCTKHT